MTGFAVAANERKFNRDTNAWEDGETIFWECSAWRNLGVNVAQSLRKGMAVIVHGKIKQRSYEKDGVKRTVMEIEVEAMGPSLGNQIAQVQKVQANQPQQGQPQQQGYAPPQPGMGAPQPGYPQAPQGYPQPGAQMPYAGGPQQVPGVPQGYPQPAGAPGGAYVAPPQQGGYAPGQYGDDTPF